ncbi:MAG TPA: Spy/CpxP family protein refolding chaperone [Candidatus Dormibacteraeota bacterium]|jgi:Spy/CpxP family protein refolding chaperone|nr:Spy/CpxP family protein refolding chaperone [Candidatus Dormibacteraeota bacterium]
MRTTLLKVTVFLVLASVFTMAQNGNPPDPAKMAQRHIDFLTKQLSLTAQQQQQATTIFSAMANNAKSTHEQMRTAHDSLKAAVQKNDAAGIEQAANTIGNLTTQMTVAHAKAQAAFYQTLTPEQQTKMNDLESRHGMGRGHGHSFGHGGPGGPPPSASL